MDSSFSSKRDTLIVESETPSGRLIEAGFLSVRQGRYAEGLAFFALARERLSPNQARLAVALDAFTQCYKAFSKAQEELLQASKRFAVADAEQQAQLAALEILMANFLEEPNNASPNINGPQHNARDNRLLYVLRSSSEDFNSNQPSSPLESTALPALYITCFGHFEVKRLGKSVVLCTHRHGQTILRYLVAQEEHYATIDTLMALLWPEDEPEAVQSRLHTTIYALRRSLNHGYTCEPGSGYIVCKNRTYCLNTAISIQTDVDQFLHYYQAGRQTSEERVAFYEKACRLYTGPFLSEDKYADWSFLQREHLSRVYIDMCRTLSDHYLEVKSYEDAERWAAAVLKEDHCNELAYRQLIRVYAVQGRRGEALQQYQRCERILREELAVQPLPETMHVVQMMLNSESTSDDEAEI